MNINMSFFEGVQLSVISMLIVFLLLYVISLVLSVFKLKSVEKKVIAKTVTTPAKVVANTKGITFEELEKDQDMLVAAIVASMEATGENKNNNFKKYEYRIRKIQPTRSGKGSRFRFVSRRRR